VRALARAGASADRLVVAEAFVSERQVVHRALAGSQTAERAEQDIHDALQHVDVSASAAPDHV